VGRIKAMGRRIFRGRTGPVVVPEDGVIDVVVMQDEFPTQEESEKVVLVTEESPVTAQVDDLFAQDQPQAAHDLLASTFDQDEALYWRFVKAHFELFAAQDDKEQQEHYLRTGIEYADKGLDQYPESGYLLKWKAILLGKLGPYQSTKERMQNSFIIRDNLEKALELLPQPDASVYQALGEWCFKVAKLSFVERQVASLLFGTPPEATYQQALDNFQQAWDIRPSSKVATKIAETFQKMGNKQEANEWKRKAETV
jgi:tetratricopeptide (TPR) repeat protein